MRWLIAIALSFAVASPATAGVFKARGQKPAANAPAKKPVEKTAPAKKTPAKAAKKAPVAKAPAKKGRGSAVAANGRPDDLTPDEAPAKKPGKKSKDADVSIVEDDEEDVIIRDIDD